MIKNTIWARSIADGVVQYLLYYILSDFLISTLVIRHNEAYFLALLLAASLSAVSLLIFLPNRFLAEQESKKTVLGFASSIFFFVIAVCFDYYCRASGIHIYIFEVYPMSAAEGLLSVLIIVSFSTLAVLMRIIYCGIAVSNSKKSF